MYLGEGVDGGVVVRGEGCQMGAVVWVRGLLWGQNLFLKKSFSY